MSAGIELVKIHRLWRVKIKLTRLLYPQPLEIFFFVRLSHLSGDLWENKLLFLQSAMIVRDCASTLEALAR